ncbi:MAG: signal peptidase I [Chloroflexi bacterium]|nr:signal peptidase I [Chloroflexota bacterium]
MSRVARDIIEALVLALVVFLLLQTTVRNFKVDGSSMDPTLEHGQYLLVNRLIYLRIDKERLAKIIPFWQSDDRSSNYAIRPPKRGEVIVFQFPRDISKDFVKRVVGLPGEVIEMRDGRVIVDGAVLEEPYLDPAAKDNSNKGEYRLKDGEYYVLGDNRTHSNDSRSWGPVPEANLKGKVWAVYWPIPGIQILNIMDRIPGVG